MLQIVFKKTNVPFIKIYHHNNIDLLYNQFYYALQTILIMFACTIYKECNHRMLHHILSRGEGGGAMVKEAATKVFNVVRCIAIADDGVRILSLSLFLR